MIRLARVGATKKPYYRVVVIEKDRARNGRSIEVVGTYNPRTNPATVNLQHDRIQYWVGVGAQCSDRVAKLVAKFPAGSAPTTPPTSATTPPAITPTPTPTIASSQVTPPAPAPEAPAPDAPAPDAPAATAPASEATTEHTPDPVAV